MAWRYTFDGGETQPIEAPSSYQFAAMAIFVKEDQNVVRIQQLVKDESGRFSYGGHVVKLWDTELFDLYPATLYGLVFDEYGCLKIVNLGNEPVK